MIRNLVKFSSILKTNSPCFNLRKKACDLYRLNVPSICIYEQNKFICSNSIQDTLLKSSAYNVVKDYVRFKSKGQKSNVRKDDSDSDEEYDEEFEEGGYDEEGNLKREIKVKSLRADSLLGKCLGLTKRRIDESFFANKFRLNGKILLKKGTELKAGDTLELCSDAVDTGCETTTVAKLNIIKVKPIEIITQYLVVFSIYKEK